MPIFFVRFWKPILIVLTILFVLTFQSYWLWNNFQIHKREILEQTKLEMQKVLMNELILKKSLEANQSIDDETKELITENLSKIIDINRLNSIGGEIIITGKDNDDILYTNKNSNENLQLDSTMYFTMKSYLQKKYNHSDITLYFESENLKKTYPKNRLVKTENTTDAVTTLSSPIKTFRIHIENLPNIIIGKMLDMILFSILYLILFLGTVFLLFNNVKINRRLLKNKEIFTRNITHELKIPISTITIAAEGFEKYNLAEEPEAAKKYIGTIKRASNQLSFFVESILQHAKAENGYKESKNAINLLVLLEDVKSILAEIIIEKRARIVYRNISEETFIKGDYNQMKQIFLNLFDNSIKYSLNEPEIVVDAKKIKDRMVIKIQDNGIGIPSKYKEEVFQPYFRATHEDVYDVKGFGLGLSFVRSSLKNQNGKIHVIESGSNGTIMELNMAAYV